MTVIELPSELPRARYVVLLVAAKKLGGYFVRHPDLITQHERPTEISQDDIDRIANMGVPVLNLCGFFGFASDEDALWFRMKYL
jgi:hypothetical protein